jgi:hypothetical protein
MTGFRQIREAIVLSAVTGLLCASMSGAGKGGQRELKPQFQTSDRCLACHNGLTTASGKDVSIGFDWRASIMANSARDPYWQASVRREDLDHPESRAAIEDSCADCHMPIARYESKLQGRLGGVFAHLPFEDDPNKNAAAEDGVSCSVCHQIGKEKLGTRESFNGGFVVNAPQAEENHPEYGPFVVQKGQARIMQTSTGGFRPTEAGHIHDSALCATCHTLYTKSLAADGKEIGLFPEQMVYLEWQHSDYPEKESCQSCHMPQVEEDAPIAAVLSEPRPGVRQHTFVGANFFMLNLLNKYRNDLSVTAMPVELTAEAESTKEFLESRSARVSIREIDIASGNLRVDVFVQNLTGHKLPTAFPSRRVWLHFLVRDQTGKKIFESGALNADGSIQGNDNDADPSRFEPHYREITGPEQVQIYEPILKDAAGHVTTGLSAATGYLKDNRLLPAGFQKQTASQDIAVAGDAADDPNFTDAGDLIRYSVPLPEARGPYHVEVELWYQPIGFRWAHNLSSYRSFETRRFVAYYESMPTSSATVLARAAADH